MRLKHKKSRSISGLAFYDIEEINVAEWSPDEEVLEPPQQVHMIISIKGSNVPFIARFRGPDSIGKVALALAIHRQNVWSDAPELKLDSSSITELKKEEIEKIFDNFFIGLAALSSGIDEFNELELDDPDFALKAKELMQEYDEVAARSRSDFTQLRKDLLSKIEVK